MTPLYPLLTALLLWPVVAAAAESGTALKDDTLRAEPYADARSAGPLKRNDKVDILEKKGAWLKVKARGKTGWVRLLSVRRGAAAQGNEAAGVLGLASGRAGTGQVVSTTGVRGLSAEELKAATFSEAEVARLEGYATSSEQAAQFAAAGGLAPRKVAQLPQPKSGGNAK